MFPSRENSLAAGDNNYAEKNLNMCKTVEKDLDLTEVNWYLLRSLLLRLQKHPQGKYKEKKKVAGAGIFHYLSTMSKLTRQIDRAFSVGLQGKMVRKAVGLGGWSQQKEL